MRKIEYKKELLFACVIFFVSVGIVFFITDENSLIYAFFDKLEWNNEVLRKSLVSILVTFIMAVIKIGFEQILEWWKIKRQPIHFALDLYEYSIDSKRKKIKNKIKFNLKDNEFIDKEINIKISLTPKNKWDLYFFKYMKLKLHIYFTPDILEVQYTGWQNQESSFNISDRKINVNVFHQANVKGKNFLNEKYVIQETIIIKPIRIKNDTTNLDFYFATEKFKLLSFVFVKKLNLQQRYEVILNEGGE